MKSYPRVILESPWAGNVEKNKLFAIACLRDSLLRGEAPFASHLLYPQALQKYNEEERNEAIIAGFSWTHAAEKSIIYTNLGISQGMIRGIAHAENLGVKVERRTLETWHG